MLSSFGRYAVGVILTGMGTDGLQGMTAIGNAGGITIGENEATCQFMACRVVAPRAGSCSEWFPCTN